MDGATSALVEQVLKVVHLLSLVILLIMVILVSWVQNGHGFGNVSYHVVMVIMVIWLSIQAIQQWIDNGGVENLIMQVLKSLK